MRTLSATAFSIYCLSLLIGAGCRSAQPARTPVLPWDGLLYPRSSRMVRFSPYDRSGANIDNKKIAPKETLVLADTSKSGIVRHLWFTIDPGEPDYLRNLQLRMFWDGADRAAVDAPFGDFFCLGHGVFEEFSSQPFVLTKAPHLAAVPGRGAFNCYFPMPFAGGMRIEITNNGPKAVRHFFYHIDVELLAELPADMLRFHARLNAEKTVPAGVKKNPEGTENYVILETQGRGLYVGCNMSVDAGKEDPGKWYEGDDMIYVDGELALHGTGTEDFYGGAWGFRKRYVTPFYGVSYRHLPDGYNKWSPPGKYTVYRFHILDPIPFQKSIRVTIEHGHANDAGNEYRSVAYWYAEPAA